MSKNHRYSKQKNLQTNPYRDNNGDLTPKYFDDTKNFDQLNDTNKKFHLRGTIKKYGEDLLSENMKDAAIELGVITAPSPSSNTGSWLTTTADVLATIPKAVVLTLAASEVLKAVGALPTGYNHNHPSAEPTDNSDVVHHRGKRGVGDISEVQSITLSNQNCFAVGVKRHPANGHIEWGELYKKCYDEPCHKGQSFVSSDEGISFNWGYVLKDLEVRSVNNEQMAEIRFSHLTSSWIRKQSYPVHHTCDLPLSPRYQHLNECNRLSSAGKYQEALTECNKALEVYPDFTQALEQKAALEELLAALTTIEPSPSSAENSTPTANSTTIMEENTPTTITEENTPNLEPHNAPFNRGSTPTVNSTTITEENTSHLKPHNAPFNRGSVPTAAPHEQTTEGQGWSLKDILTAAGSATIAVITVGGIATYIYKKGTAICQEYCSKTEEPYSTFVFLVPNVEDINLMGNRSGDADSSEATL